jgi:hypothetical protein
VIFVDEYKLYMPDGTNTYPADIDTLGIEPEMIIREAVNKKTDYKSKKEAPVDKRETMVNAQMITEMMDNKLQL